MVKEKREEIVETLEQVGHYTGENWRAEVYDGYVYVTQNTDDKTKSRLTRMTWDTFMYLFLKDE